MDKALEEIIKTRPRGVRKGSRRKSGGKQEIVGRAVPSPVAKAKVAAATNKPVAQPADKIIVSNLPQDVNEAQIKELFHSTVGPVRTITLNYDANGRSKGSAAVQFQHKGDGTKAYQHYNGRLIDGSRPMKIEIVVDPAKPAQSLAARVAPTAPAAVAGANSAARTGRGVGAGRRGGRAPRPKKVERTTKSAADLDAEMEDYAGSTAAPAS